MTLFEAWTQMELAVLHWLSQFRTDLMDSFMPAVTRLSDHGEVWMLIVLVLLCIPKTRRIGLAAGISLLAGYLIGNLFLKNLFERQRPCWIDPSVQLLVESPKDYSFPSGHTLASFTTALAVFFFDRRLGLPMLVLAAVIAYSRLYLFVHFPTDILGGLLLALLISWGVSKGFRCLFREKAA